MSRVDVAVRPKYMITICKYQCLYVPRSEIAMLAIASNAIRHAISAGRLYLVSCRLMIWLTCGCDMLVERMDGLIKRRDGSPQFT